MIQYIIGDLFSSETEAIVNTINTVGVMGKGIAKKFKELYPNMFDEYKVKCDNNEIKVGELFIYKTDDKIIINFPTKSHWRSNSKINDIANGLNKLREYLINNNVESIAIPALGCGNGGLNWSDVKRIVEFKLREINTDIKFYITKQHHFEDLTREQLNSLQNMISSLKEDNAVQSEMNNAIKDINIDLFYNYYVNLKRTYEELSKYRKATFTKSNNKKLTNSRLEDYLT